MFEVISFRDTANSTGKLEEEQMGWLQGNLFEILIHMTNKWKETLEPLWSHPFVSCLLLISNFLPLLFVLEELIQLLLFLISFTGTPFLIWHPQHLHQQSKLTLSLLFVSVPGTFLECRRQNPFYSWMQCMIFL